MENEIWKPIVDYEEYYEVSNLGRVKRIKAGMGARASKILKQYLGSDGYMRIGLTVNNKEKYFFVHRLVATAFIPNLENKPQVNHIDGNKLNNSVSNLEWVTAQENIDHAWRTGLLSEKSRKKMSMYANNMTLEHKKKLSEASKGRIWINNGIERRKVKSDNLQEFLNDGYVLGMSKLKKH